jgi:hypothetical protein
VTAAQRYVLAAIVSCAAVACFVGAIVTCASGCAALESDAKKVEAPLAAGCSFLESATGDNAWVDFGCATAEAADALVASFPSGQATASTATDASPNGPTTAAFWRVHVALKSATPAALSAIAHAPPPPAAQDAGGQ